MKRVIQIAKRSGRWMYRISDGSRIVVDWQYGPEEKTDVIRQAQARFGNVQIVEEKETV